MRYTCDQPAFLTLARPVTTPLCQVWRDEEGLTKKKIADLKKLIEELKEKLAKLAKR